VVATSRGASSPAWHRLTEIAKQRTADWWPVVWRSGSWSGSGSCPALSQWTWTHSRHGWTPRPRHRGSRPYQREDRRQHKCGGHLHGAVACW